MRDPKVSCSSSQISQELERISIRINKEVVVGFSVPKHFHGTMKTTVAVPPHQTTKPLLSIWSGVLDIMERTIIVGLIELSLKKLETV